MQMMGALSTFTDMISVNCPIKLSNKHDAYTVLLVLKSGW